MEILGNEDHRIFYGDVMPALEKYIKDESADLIFADPPYNIGKVFNGHKEYWESEQHYLDWCYQWMDLCLRKLKPNGSLYLMASTQCMPYFDIYLRNRLYILSRVVWTYDSSGRQARHYYGSLYEPMLFGVKNKKHYTFNAKDILIKAPTGAERKLMDYRKDPPRLYNPCKVPGNVWNFARVRYRMGEYEEHPTQKPEALLERIIRASSNRGDLVLDLFAGTFTTAAVARRLQRRSVSIECQEDYIKIGLRRLGLAGEYKGELLKKDRPRANNKT